MTDTVIPWGPQGKVVFDRTYSRPLHDGGREEWPDTVHRTVTGNLRLVYGEPSNWTEAVWQEYDQLCKYMLCFAIIPAGRHLWMSGVKGREYLFNCHVAGWTDKVSGHVSFTALRLFEGGGVGSNYSQRFVAQYAMPKRALTVHIVCDESHADYQAMKDAGLLSDMYCAEWEGSWQVVDTREGWADAQKDLIDTYFTNEYVAHQHRVYDVTNVRRSGSRLKSSGGTASGPLPFAQMMVKTGALLNKQEELGHLGQPTMSGVVLMLLDHYSAEAVVAGGARRSARMSIMHWKDIFIWEFLRCKSHTGDHWTTNISVEIDNDFLSALSDSSHPDHEHARDLHMAVVRGMLTNGEPGYWNSEMTNMGEVFEVIATNPCGEIGLPAWGACCLGHVNLNAFAPRVKGGPFDMPGMLKAHRLMTRFLVRATSGDMNDENQKRTMELERRIGVGHLGVQDFLVKRGIRYSQAPYDSRVEWMLKRLKTAVREEARNYAFELRWPEPVKVTTVAPTGSISKLPGVAGEGIHPVLFRYWLQGVRFTASNPNDQRQIEEARARDLNVEQCMYDSTGNTIFVQYPTKSKLVQEVEELGYDASIVETAGELTVEQMLAFQAMYQTHYADNAVSFTVNVPAEPEQQDYMLKNPLAGTMPIGPSPKRLHEVAKALAYWLPSLKGTTLMLDGSRPQAPYQKISQADYELYQMTSMASVGDGVDEDCATGACPVR